ncbi:MAG: hypothetical protein ACXIUM_01545 [Wenzhouxiangella sp.]
MSHAHGLEQLLLRPFDRIPAPSALVLGVSAILITAVLAAALGLQTRTVLELQFVDGGTVLRLLVQGILNWLSLSLALILTARWLQAPAFSSFRLLSFQAAARWPLLLSVGYLSIPPLGQQIRELTQRLSGAMPSEPGQVMADAIYMADAMVLTLLGVPLLVFMVWTVWLMFHGYQRATGLHGQRAVFSFAGGLVAAWVLSRSLSVLLA